MADASAFIRWFGEIGLGDVPLVGGKNAIARAIADARRIGRKIGLCGRAPSERPPRRVHG